MSRTIGQLAKAAAVSVETIRFYERKGLIEQPEKPVQGYRQYPDSSLQRIRFIQQCKTLGFTLSEIISLLSLNDQPCVQVQQLAENKLQTVREKMADLRRLEDALQGSLEKCENNDDKGTCPIIASLQP